MRRLKMRLICFTFFCSRPLVEHKLVFIACVYATGLLNYALTRLASRIYARQSFITRDEWRPPGLVSKAKSRRAQEALPLFGATIFSLASLFLDPTGVELILGGFFCLQLLSLALMATNILTYRSLADPRSAVGHISYSPWFRYRSFGGFAFGAAVIAAIAFALTGAVVFAGAFLFSCATGAGAYRRARQAAALQHADATPPGGDGTPAV
jgi:hypothetical protein